MRKRERERGGGGRERKQLEGLICTTSSGRYNCWVSIIQCYMTYSASRDFRLTNQGLLKDHSHVLVVPDRPVTPPRIWPLYTTLQRCRNQNNPHPKHVGIFEIWSHDQLLHEIVRRITLRDISHIYSAIVLSSFISFLVIDADTWVLYFIPRRKNFELYGVSFFRPPPFFCSAWLQGTLGNLAKQYW